MSNTSLKATATAIALLVLTGCNLPFLGKAAKTIEEKAGNAMQKVAEETDENVGEEEETKREVRNEGDNGNSGSKTDIEVCLKGCGYLDGTGMFSKEFCVDSCWASVAKDMKDISICDTKVDPKNDLVQSACRINVAEETLNPKDCEGIGATADDMFRISCYSTVAKKKKDPSVCDLITSGMFKSVCVEDANSAE